MPEAIAIADVGVALLAMLVPVVVLKAVALASRTPESTFRLRLAATGRYGSDGDAPRIGWGLTAGVVWWR